MNIAEVDKMTRQERLQVMEAIWDSLTHEKPEIKSPEWHEGILMERKSKIASGTAEFISIKELKEKHSR